MKEYKDYYSDFRLNKDAVTKKLKMKAGAPQDHDYNFNDENFKQAFLNICRYSVSNEQQNLKVLYKKIHTLGLILFGINLEFIKGSYYLPYIYYLFKDTVKFKKIKVVNSNIIFENVTFEKLSEEKLNGIPITTLLLNILSDQKKNKFISNKRNEDLWNLINKLNEKIQLSQPQQLQPQQLQPQLFQSQINPIFNITKQNSNNKYNYYRCEEPSLEVKINPDGNIFFGYDEYLFSKAKDNSYKLYYKYSYRNRNFFELKKQNETFEEKQIDINKIPTYDILRLYYAIKGLKNKQELEQKLQTRINILKQNISKTGEVFIKLDHSNFEKEKKEIRNLNATENTKKITSSEYKNFGKVKKRKITEKTYIFFGAKLKQNGSRNFSSYFMYVCFREDNNVFYYEKADINKKIPLYEFPYIYPLEDLISFILLRRLITNDSTFADIIYKEADARIKFLKTNKFAEKMLIKEFPENYSYGSRNILYKSISLLPVSSQKII